MSLRLFSTGMNDLLYELGVIAFAALVMYLLRSRRVVSSQ